jgi:acid phosphatase type 7
MKVYSLLFLLLLAAAQAQTLVRAPYLQKGSPTAATVCWRVSDSIAVQLRYGSSIGSLVAADSQAAVGTDACVELKGLQPDTKYFYALYSGTTQLAGGEDFWLRTHPPADAKKRTVIWLVGDAGSGYKDQANTRDGWMKVNGGAHADVMILLGDNAYLDGTDADLTKNHFAPYAATLRNSFSWATLGNHDAYGPTKEAPHLAAWNMPTAGESGGVPSGSELYYSFDYGNIHFICLDSQRNLRTKTGPMYLWLEADLAATKKDWIIAYFHHAPYSFGSYNTDVEPEKHPEMRGIFVPLLEKYGVDFVYTGHSHSYERSFLINGAYGISTDNTANMATIAIDSKSGDYTTTDGPYRKADARAGNKGTIYTVAGSGSEILAKEVPEKHPVMYSEHVKLGTAQLIIEDQSAIGMFIDDEGNIQDRFAVVQGDGVVRSSLVMPKKGGILFEKLGRSLVFAKNAWGKPLHIWDSRGSLAFRGKITGQMLFPADKFRPGVYHYRSEGYEGSLLLD